MKYYKDSTTNEVYAYKADGSQDSIIKDTFVLMTDDEVSAFLNAQLPAGYAIKEQIRALEATITPRRLREATLTANGKTWLADIDAQIAELRAQLV